MRGGKRNNGKKMRGPCISWERRRCSCAAYSIVVREDRNGLIYISFLEIFLPLHLIVVINKCKLYIYPIPYSDRYATMLGIKSFPDDF